MKKLISLALVAILVLTLAPATLLPVGAEPVVYDGSSVSTSLSGTGTEADPYIIANGADLAFFAQKTTALTEADSAFYKLTNDIVWSSYTTDGTAPAASNWTPIVGDFFTGTFDGDGHSISGIYVDCVLTTGTGLFASINGTLKNLTLKDSYIAANTHVGGLVGYVKSGFNATLTNLTNYASVVHKVKDGRTGGILGRSLEATLVMTGCVNYGTVKSLVGNGYMGGIIGEASKPVANTIRGCANFGEIIGATALVGGISGSAGNSGATYAANPVDYIDCLNAGTVTGIRIIGGIVGRSNGGVKFTNCINIGDVVISIVDAGEENDQGFGNISGSTKNKSDDGAITNCYYRAGAARNSLAPTAVSATEGVGTQISKTEAELKGAGVVAALGLDSEIWQDGGVGEYLTLKVAVAETPDNPDTPDTFDTGIVAICAVLVLSFASLATISMIIYRKKAMRR